MRRPRSFTHKRIPQIAIAGAALLALAACAPGSDAEDSTTSQPAESSAPAGSSAPAASASTGVAPGFDTTQPVTITVSDGWGTTGTGELFGKVIDEFEAKYPNVTVVRDTTDYDSYSASILLKGSSPNPPDVMMLQTAGYGQGFYQFAKSGLLLPLDDYAKAYGWSGRFGADANLDVFRFDAGSGDQWGSGPLLGVPEQNAMVSVFYNAKLMKEAGIESVPTTWAEFEDSLAKAKAAGITPIAQHNSYIHTYMAIWNAMTESASPVNDWIYGRGGSFDTDASVKTAQTIADWQAAGYFQDGVTGATYGDASGAFLNGNALYYIEGSWMTGAVESSLKSDGGVFQLPGMSGASGVPAGGGLTTPLTISSKSAHPDVAAAFLDFFTSQEVSDELFAGGWGLPGASVSPEMAEGSSLTSQVLTMLTPIEADGGAGTTPFLDWAAPTLTEQLPAALQQMAAGSITPAEFTAQIQSITAAFADERAGS